MRLLLRRESSYKRSKHVLRIQIVFLLEIQLHRGTTDQDCMFVSNGFFSAEFSVQEVCHDLCGLGTGGGSLRSKLFPSRSAIRPCATAHLMASFA